MKEKVPSLVYSSGAPLSWPSCSHPRTISTRDTEGSRGHQHICQEKDGRRPSWCDRDEEPVLAAPPLTLAVLLLMAEQEEEEEDGQQTEVGTDECDVQIDTVRRASDRLFFEAAGDSSMILPVKLHGKDDKWEEYRGLAAADASSLISKLQHEEEQLDEVERLVRDVRMATRRLPDRLFFEPTGDCSSIMHVVDEENPGKAASSSGVVSTSPTPFKGGGVPLAVTSTDPYADFRKSMEEMVVAHGWMGWDWMKEMLEWYLQANGSSKCYSDTIVQAFVDMLMDRVLSAPAPNGDVVHSSASTSSCSSSCPASPAHSSCSSLSSE